jgi:hypothetical protein
VSADAGEQVDELSQVAEVQRTIAAKQQRDSTDGGAVVSDSIVVRVWQSAFRYGPTRRKIG